MHNQSNWEKFLTARYKTQIKLTPLGVGGWAKAYKFTNKAVNGGKACVIRVSHTVENFQRDLFAYNLAKHRLPIPRVVEVGSYGDQFFAISEFASGDYFEELPAERLEQLMPSLFQVFQGLNSIDLSPYKGYGYFDHTGTAPYTSWKDFIKSVSQDVPGRGNLIHGWKRNFLEAKIDRTVFDQLTDQLSSLLPILPESRNLVHSDLLNFNVLADSQKITAVLDWGSAMFGDSLYDLAWFQFYEKWYPEFSKIKLVVRLEEHLKTAVVNQEHWQERLKAYQIHIALGSIAYNSFIRNWKNLHAAERRIIELLQQKKRTD